MNPADFTKPSKRKSPPPSFSPTQHLKRQRLDSPADSLSGLSSLSSPEEIPLAAQTQISFTSHLNPNSGLFSGGGTGDGDDGEEASDDDDDGFGELEQDDDEDDEVLAGSGAGGGGGGNMISSKSIPKHQPRPPQEVPLRDGPATTVSEVGTPTSLPGTGTATPTKSAGASKMAGSKSKSSGGPGPLRPTVGGKGKKGEDALEQAVAAREEVERRRVELKGSKNPNANGVGSKKPANGVSVRMTVGGSGSGSEEGVKTVKQEDEEVQIVDSEEEVAVPVKRERPAIKEERENIIRFEVVTNDSTPESLIILTGLKNIFQKQLPKMPREYIARLVYDRNHYSMAIVKRGLEVVGGITYRPFEAREFAEIVFCAITGTEQVKGYGSHLMNHLKDYVKATTKCMHFLTYADNYAIGYFKKQGFTKEVGLDRSVWAGYIKDYEGGTIMHCSMLERIKYLEVASILSQQKEVILSEIRQNSQSHVVHHGLDPSLFANLPPDGAIDPSLVPGLKESGWTPEMDELTRRPKRGPQFAIMQRLLTSLIDHPSAWAFTAPVNGEDVTDYYKVITQPMDLSTMERKLESDMYQTLPEFVDDAKLIFSNCRSYNDSQSNYVKNANKLENFLNEQVKLFDP